MNPGAPTRLVSVLCLHGPPATVAAARADVAAQQGQILGQSTAGEVIVEFASAIEAARCAVLWRQTLPAGPDFRIGIDLGEIAGDGDAADGEGIEVARRLTAAPEASAVAVSGVFHDQVVSKLPFSFDGPRVPDPRSRQRPARIFRLIGQARDEPASSMERLSMPDRPSVAVLPLTNPSNDPAEDYFSDGVTEDIITELARYRGLFVIAPHSSFIYRHKTVARPDIGRQLGVHYVLEGSVRRAGQRMRVSVALVEAHSGRQMWAERYDRDLADIFAVQEEVAETIAATLAGRLQSLGAERAQRKRPGSLAAYDYFLRSLEALGRYSRSYNEEARALLQQALALDPDYAPAHARLGNTHLYDYFWGDDAALEVAAACADAAVALDDNDPWAQMVAGRVQLYRRQFDTAAAHHQRAEALNPSDADIVANMALFQVYLGQAGEAVETIERAMRLNPACPEWYREHRALALLAAGRYAEAIDCLERIAEPPPWVTIYRAVACLRAGRLTEALHLAAAVAAADPDHDWTRFLDTEPYKDKATLARLGDDLRRLNLLK